MSVYNDESDEQSLVHVSQVVTEQKNQYAFDQTTGLYQTTAVIQSAPKVGYIEEERLNPMDYAP
mgnify:FL=1